MSDWDGDPGLSGSVDRGSEMAKGGDYPTNLDEVSLNTKSISKMDPRYAQSLKAFLKSIKYLLKSEAIVGVLVTDFDFRLNILADNLAYVQTQEVDDFRKNSLTEEVERLAESVFKMSPILVASNIDQLSSKLSPVDDLLNKSTKKIFQEAHT